MFVLIIALVFGLAAALAWLLVKASIPLAERFGLLDAANARSMHVGTIPRSGGLGLLAAVLVVQGLLTLFSGLSTPGLWAFAAVAIVAVTSLADDRVDLMPSLRLIAHLAAALMVFFAGFAIHQVTLPGLALAMPGLLAGVITTGFVIWFLNLYNFMDGLDGLAGGMGLIGFGWLGLLGLIGGAPVYALSAAAVAGACLGFLSQNFPPARVFMGDVGSACLGFLVALFLLWGEWLGVVPLWAGVMIFSPFFFDATVTLVMRLRAGHKVWEAHRDHFYQQAVRRIGLSKRQVLLAEYLLMLAVGMSAAVVVPASPALQWAAIAGWLAGYAVLGISIKKSGRRALNSERHGA